MTIRVLYPFSGHIIGGSHISTLTLITHLPEGIEPVIGIFSEGILTKYLDDHGIRWVKLPTLSIAVTPLSLVKEMAQVLRCALPLHHFLKEHEIDIIHSQEYNMHCLWAVAKIGTRAKHIWHQRSINNSRRLALYAPFVDYYVTISQFCKDHLVAPVAKRAEVLHNPVDVEQSDLHKESQLEELAAGRFRIGFVGHLDVQKRAENFVEIAHTLKQKNLKVSFFMFGNSKTEYAELIQNKIKDYGLQETCYLMGQRFPIAPWIKELDVLVAPAAHEGLGRSIIEAQMIGTPVIASNDGGHKELIRHGETGFLIALDDVPAFAEMVESLIKNPSLSENIKQRAKAEASDKFSVHAHIERMTQIYYALKP